MEVTKFNGGKEMEKYNGWTNYETWKVNLEYFDGAQYEEKVTSGMLKDDVEWYIEEAEGNALVKNWALNFISDVNWQEIADGLNEGLDDDDE